MKRILLAIVLLLVIAGSPACSRLAASKVEEQSVITATGVIQAEEVMVTPELGGRIVALLATEGQEVAAGDLLAQLDDSLIAAKMQQAEAALATAQAELEEMKARPRQEAVRAAEAALAQAIAARDGAERAWQAAEAILQNPQELLRQIEEARSQMALAEQKIEQARVDLVQARNLRDSYRNPSDEYYIHSFLVQAAEEAVKAAEAERDAAQASLQGLLAIRANPIALQAEVHAAEGNYRKAVAAVGVAEAALAAASAGARPEELALYQAKVAQAESALQILRTQQAKQKLYAPRSGVITNVILQQGELAPPGATVITIADLDHVRLTVYIQERDLPRIWLGQRAHVTVDAFPERTFEGEVVYIASEAEFIPRNVESTDQRVQTVFEVRIALPNPARELKPGMSADVRLP